LRSSKATVSKSGSQGCTRASRAYGMPWDYPVELHVYEEEECREALKRVKHVEIIPGR